jgi:hypothetical protein
MIIQQIWSMQNKLLMFIQLTNPSKMWQSSRIVVTITNQNYIYRKVTTSWNSGNSCYHAALRLLIGLSKTVTIKIYKRTVYNLIFCVCVCETRFFAVMTEH